MVSPTVADVTDVELPVQVTSAETSAVEPASPSSATALSGIGRRWDKVPNVGPSSRPGAVVVSSPSGVRVGQRDRVAAAGGAVVRRSPLTVTLSPGRGSSGSTLSVTVACACACGAGDRAPIASAESASACMTRRFTEVP
jgi:hypothetical protein